MIAAARSEPLATGWRAAACAPGAVLDPRGLDAAGLAWIDAAAPSTAAAALRAAGRFSLDGPARRFDAEDWWWRGRFHAEAAAPFEDVKLCFDGLATLAEVWLDGARILSSASMWRRHAIALGDRAGGEHEIALRFRALDAALAEKRPRPRWRAPMIEHQQLRFHRTTLLGRTPGWSPPAAAVGPWRPIRIERRAFVAIEDVRVAARVEGDDGVVEIACRIEPIGGAEIRGATLFVERDEAPLTRGSDGVCRGRVVIPRAARWWPHTHGEPALHAARLVVALREGEVEMGLGALGFREIALSTEGSDFALSVNGAPIFCRGACFTPLDPVSLSAPRAAYDAAIEGARDAGMNMLRLSGAMIYEDAAFFDACDREGVLVWQDLMFANMDYPEGDAVFEAEVIGEAREVLTELARRPSLALICGSSEGEQQAAMFGATRDRWSPRLFHEALPRVAREVCPEVPWCASSATGGAFPHEARTGPTSYYGVGAYLRPLDDARRAEVRFASECLAFANVPEPSAIARMPGGASSRVHHPSWKARSPRDLGAGWDFDDVRDQYVATLYGVDPTRVRWADHDRYLALGRAATGEVMAATFAEWRRARSTCRGALVWFLRDLWAGAGWGVLDETGAPKAAWFHLRRALAPVAISLSDEGVNGVFVHAVNDRSAPFEGSIEVALTRGEVAVARAREAVTIGARAAIERPAAALFEGFLDTSYAYRFGPPSHDLVVATLRDAGGAAIAEAFHFPVGRPAARDRDLGLTAEARARGDGALDLVVRARRHAHGVVIDAEGFSPSDNHFHLAPGGARELLLRPIAGARAGALRGAVSALNAETTSRITVVSG